MKFQLALIAIILVSISCSLLGTHEFRKYRETFDKKYGSEEEAIMRMRIFQENMRKIHLINNDPNSKWKAGINHLTDRTPEELKQNMGYKKEFGTFSSSIQTSTFLK